MDGWMDEWRWRHWQCANNTVGVGAREEIVIAANVFCRNRNVMWHNIWGQCPGFSPRHLRTQWNQSDNTYAAQPITSINNRLTSELNEKYLLLIRDDISHRLSSSSFSKIGLVALIESSPALVVSRAMLCAPFVKLPPSNRISSHLWWFLWFIENSIMHLPSSCRTASRCHIFRLPNLMKQKIPLCFSLRALHARGLRCPDSLFCKQPNCVRCHKAFTCSDESRNDVKRFTMAVWSPDAYACSSLNPRNNDGNVIRYLYSPFLSAVVAQY